ncbi:MAG: hemin uptake protein HemP [Burkholderiaceae bacterium]
MTRLPRQESSKDEADQASDSTVPSLLRIKSQELFKQAREVEIEHEGRIYRLRLTQSNKLILTA